MAASRHPQIGMDAAATVDISLALDPFASVATEDARHRFRPLFVAGMTAILMLAMPAAILEIGIGSIGLSEIAPVLAAPLGWAGQGLLALVAAAIAGGVAHLLSGATPIGWSDVAMRARGSQTEPSLVRRKIDLHPDAPPRPPVLASRDLPGADAATAEMPAIPVEAPPVVVAQGEPKRLPNSPEPMAEGDLDAFVATLPPLTPLIRRPADLDGAPLLSLVDHFERQVDRRAPVSREVQAQEMDDAPDSAPDSALDSAPDRATPVDLSARTEEPSDVCPIDEALNTALDMLKQIAGDRKARAAR